MYNEYNVDFDFDDYKDINEIEDKLWLGNSFSAGDIKDLKEKGIKKILTVMNGTPHKYNKEDGFNHKIIDIMDTSYENIIQFFGECLNFIKGDEKVLVHCAAGASRSATIVIAYLMWKNKMKLDESLKFVQKKRSIVDPNTGFKEQLRMFEKLLIENDYDIDKINFKEIKWVPPENMPSY